MNNAYWNWQQKDWPYFSYKSETIKAFETKFLEQSGLSFGVSKHINDQEKKDITVNLISNEAYKTSEIEGELLDRDSLQSSIKKHFGYKEPTVRNHPQERGIAEMMIDLYHHYDQLLTHKTLWEWHEMLMNGRRDLNDIGRYRMHEEPMQVVSGYLHDDHQHQVHFEAPPSKLVRKEMDEFIVWFNKTAPGQKDEFSILTRAAIAHLYFLSIHPFEDGNGRIGRAIVEKVLAQHLKRPTLIALSQIIQDDKKSYYAALETQNKHNKIDGWLEYFSDVILKAQQYTISEMEFLIKKAKFFDCYRDQVNERQEKAIGRMFLEGTKGFEGGLSAHNYVTITKTSASTATRDLKDMVDKKILIQSGKSKSTRYSLNIDLVD